MKEKVDRKSEVNKPFAAPKKSGEGILVAIPIKTRHYGSPPGSTVWGVRV